MPSHRLTPSTAILLTLPPLLWAGNAVVGRVVAPLVPPITLNFLRNFTADSLRFLVIELVWLGNNTNLTAGLYRKCFFNPDMA